MSKKNQYENDSDETEGRKIYRGKANALANAQMNRAQRKVYYKKIKTHIQEEPEEVPLTCAYLG